MRKCDRLIFLSVVSAVFLTTGFVSTSYAIDSPPKCYRFNNEAVPYGYYGHHWRKTGYGQRINIRNIEEAISVVQEFYKSPNLKVVPVKESYRFYKMEVQDDHNTVLDIVIVDKFSGRVRSIY